MTTITLTFNPLTPVPDADTDVLASVLRDDGSIEVWEAHFEHGTWWSSNATTITSPVVSWAHKPAGVDLRKGLALAAPAPAVPSGWKLVPVEPTREMNRAGFDAHHATGLTGEIWRAMLTAAPTPPAQSDDDEATIADYQEALRSVDALVRRLDIALNGEAGASPQARLCDIVSQVEARQQPAVPMTDEQATLLNQAHDMLLAHADYQRSRGNDSEAKGAECSADAVLKLAAAWASAPAVPESADNQPPQAAACACMPEGLRYKMPPLVLNGNQLLAALDFIAPDRTEEQMDQQVCLALRDQVRDEEGGTVPAGLFVWYDEYPEEGALPLDDTPFVPPKQPAVPEDAARIKAAMSIAMDALDEIALAGMSGTGQESEEAMRDWHARRAWEFIGISARARDAARKAEKGGA